MEQKERRIALLHHTGCGNFGDDAIVDVVLSNIRERWENAKITVLSMNPEDTIRRHGVPCRQIRRHRWSIGHESSEIEPTQPNGNRFKQWLQKTRNPAVRLPRAVFGEFLFLIESYRFLRPFDLLIVSGGGQLTERGGPWSFPYALFAWTLMAKWAGVRCIFLNVGAGPLNHPLSRFFVPRALRRAEYVSFRDKESQELASELGFTHSSHVFPDNVYGFESIPVAAPAQASTEPVVGIAPMPYPFSDLLTFPVNAQALQDTLNDKIATFASLLVEQSYTLELFGSDSNADPLAIEELREGLLGHHQIAMPEYVPPESVSELLARMSKMDYVVTCRFHGVVFAHLLNKPVLAIAHHRKVTHLMSALGLSKYCVDMLTFDPFLLMNSFTSLVNESEAVKKGMALSLTSYRERLANQFDELFPPGLYGYRNLSMVQEDFCRAKPQRN